MSWEHLSEADQALLNGVAGKARKADAERSNGELVCLALLVALMAVLSLWLAAELLPQIGWAGVTLDQGTLSRGPAAPVEGYHP